MARFIELNVKGKDDTSLPMTISTDRIVCFAESPGGLVQVDSDRGAFLVVETYEEMRELVKEPELVEGLSIVDQVWPSCLKDPSAV